MSEFIFMEFYWRRREKIDNLLKLRHVIWKKNKEFKQINIGFLSFSSLIPFSLSN